MSSKRITNNHLKSGILLRQNGKKMSNLQSLYRLFCNNWIICNTSDHSFIPKEFVSSYSLAFKWAQLFINKNSKNSQAKVGAIKKGWLTARCYDNKVTLSMMKAQSKLMILSLNMRNRITGGHWSTLLQDPKYIQFYPQKKIFIVGCGRISCQYRILKISGYRRSSWFIMPDIR